MGNERLAYLKNKIRTDSVINEQSETTCRTQILAVQTRHSGQTIKHIWVSKLINTYPLSHKNNEEICVLMAANSCKQENQNWHNSRSKTVLSVRSKIGTQLLSMLKRDLEQVCYHGIKTMLIYFTEKCKNPVPCKHSEG